MSTEGLTLEEKDVLYYIEEMCDRDGIFWIRRGRLKNLSDNTGLKTGEIKKILKSLCDKKCLELIYTNPEGYLLCA